MITKNQRFISILLCILLSLGGVSCSNKSAGNDSESSQNADISENTAETAADTAFLDDIPEGTTFGGESIRFILNRDLEIIYIDEDESDLGEALNEAVWKRNNLLEDRLEVSIAEPIVSDSSQMTKIIPNSVQSGSDDYDIMIGHARFNSGLVLRNSIRCLDDLQYLDLEKPYWSQGFNENVAYNGSHFWIVGDISKYYISSTYVILANSMLWNNHFEGQDLYEIVREGKWTIDKLKEFSASAYKDLNGNGIKDEEDAFGFASKAGHIYNGMFFAANVQYTSFDSEGIPHIAINNEHSLSVFEQLRDLLYNGDGVYRMNDDAINLTMFVSDRLLFKPGQFSDLEDERIRNMETNFYAIPMPKYDEVQENYRSSQHDGTSIYGVLSTVHEERLDPVSATLEAMCSMASTMVIPVYYDDILKSKYSRDPETAEMIDLIRSSLETDFGHVWSDSISSTSIFLFFTDKINNDHIASYLEKSEKVWIKGLDKLIASLDDVAAQYN